MVDWIVWVTGCDGSVVRRVMRLNTNECGKRHKTGSLDDSGAPRAVGIWVTEAEDTNVGGEEDEDVEDTKETEVEIEAIEETEVDKETEGAI